MRLAALVLSGLLLAAGAVRAQDEEAIDADYRSSDTIVVDGYAAPLVGTILEGGPGTPRVKIKTDRGVITEVAGDKVREWKLRETPESAFKARVTRLEKRKAGAPEHRLLAEWAVKHGLLDGAESELTIAADGEPDAARATKHRERLVDLLEQRLLELPAESADAVHEKVLRQVQKAEAAGGASPRLQLAKARVALALHLPEVARAALGRAIAGLDAALQGAGPPPATEPPAPGTEPGTPAPGTEPAPPRRVFKRDVGLDPGPQQPVQPPPAAPEPAQDNSDAMLSGLEPPQRDAWREALLLDAEAAARLGQLEDAQAAWERLLEVWPQERQATLGLAQLLVSFGARGAALDLVGQTLKVFPRDAELLLIRGQIRTLLAQTAADYEGPRQDLELALAAATQGRAAPPTPAPGAPPRPTTVEPLVREVKTALGLVLLFAGKFDEARATLEAADVEPGHGPARLARALLAESQGNVAAARTHYEEAARLLAPQDGEARYGLAFVRAADDATAAQAALRDALREGHSAELVLRALEDLARRRNDAATEAKLLEVHVRSSDDPSPDLLARLARTWQAQERFDEARALLQRGLADSPDHLGCLRGLAWDAYRSDDRDKARALLERIVAQCAKDQVKDDWAARALKNLEDVRTRRVWTDGFDRPGPEVKNSWVVEASFGVEAGIADGKLYLHGKQANGVAPEGRTRVRRAITGEQVAKVEARLNLDALGDAFRGGLRLEAASGPGVVLFKDQDGRVKVSVASRKGDFSDPVDLGDCPGGLVTFGIELTDPKAGLVTLWVGGQPRGEPQKVAGLTGDVDVSLYVQGSRLGADTKLTVDEVRVFVVRAAGSGPKQGGGY